MNPIGETPFTDGIIRPIYLDTSGHQFVLDADGQRVYGTWVYIDEPEIVKCAASS